MGYLTEEEKKLPGGRMKCKHNLKEISKGFNTNTGYSPTILKCSLCGKYFCIRTGRIHDTIDEIDIRMMKNEN